MPVNPKLSACKYFCMIYRWACLIWNVVAPTKELTWIIAARNRGDMPLIQDLLGYKIWGKPCFKTQIKNSGSRVLSYLVDTGGDNDTALWCFVLLCVMHSTHWVLLDAAQSPTIAVDFLPTTRSQSEDSHGVAKNSDCLLALNWWYQWYPLTFVQCNAYQ